MNKARISTKLEDFERQRLALAEKSKKLWPSLILFPILVVVLTLGLLSLGFIGRLEFIPYPLIFSIVISGIWRDYAIKKPFKKIKEKVKNALVEEFINTYHPQISFNYNMDYVSAKNIIRSSKLISADIYNEEDVIAGQNGDATFYISEIELEDENDDSKTTIFKGMLISLRIPGQDFPKSRIQSKMGLLSKWFSGFVKEELYGFWYDTEDQYAFQEKLEALFPFITHLAKKQGDIRISIQGEEITIMMESDMKFMDTPDLGLNDSFINQEYFSSMAKQLNSQLFIMDAFQNDLKANQIEERLKLYELELVENKMKTK